MRRTQVEGPLQEWTRWVRTRRSRLEACERGRTGKEGPAKGEDGAEDNSSFFCTSPGQSVDPAEEDRVGCAHEAEEEVRGHFETVRDVLRESGETHCQQSRCKRRSARVDIPKLASR